MDEQIIEKAAEWLSDVWDEFGERQASPSYEDEARAVLAAIGPELEARGARRERAAWEAVTGDPTPEHAKATNADIAATLEELARQRDAAELRGARRVVEAVREVSPRLNIELRPDGTEDKWAAAYVEGYKDAMDAARAAVAEIERGES